jgi:hypothetical protein
MKLFIKINSVHPFSLNSFSFLLFLRHLLFKPLILAVQIQSLTFIVLSDSLGLPIKLIFIIEFIKEHQIYNMGVGIFQISHDS